jgi:hypothetical protein
VAPSHATNTRNRVRQMTVSDLERLVTKTEVTPATEVALNAVRKAIVSGRCGDAVVGRGKWSVALYTGTGNGVKMNFSFKRD